MPESAALPLCRMALENAIGEQRTGSFGKAAASQAAIPPYISYRREQEGSLPLYIAPSGARTQSVDMFIFSIRVSLRLVADHGSISP